MPAHVPRRACKRTARPDCGGSNGASSVANRGNLHRMRFKDLPANARFFDLDGIAVADLPDKRAAVAFVTGKGQDVESREYPWVGQVRHAGDELSRDEFARWLDTGKNRFFV
jgi:hypothetical protein